MPRRLASVSGFRSLTVSRFVVISLDALRCLFQDSAGVLGTGSCAVTDSRLGAGFASGSGSGRLGSCRGWGSISPIHSRCSQWSPLRCTVHSALDSNPQVDLLDSDLQQAVLDGLSANLAAQVPAAPASIPQSALLHSDLQQAVLHGLSATLAAQVPVAPDSNPQIAFLDFNLQQAVLDGLSASLAADPSSFTLQLIL